MIHTFFAPDRLLNSPVTVQLVGAGGTGSQMADALASLEVTLRELGHPGFNVTVYDDDRVSRANIGRQRFTAADIGHYKVHVLTHRLCNFYHLGWQAVPKRLAPRDIQCDLLITCTDSALFRASVGKTFATRQTETLWLDTGNGASTAQALLASLGVPRETKTTGGARGRRRRGEPSAPTSPTITRLPNVYQLWPELATMRAADREEPSCSVEQAITRQEWPVNRVIATMAANLLWNLFRKGQITTHGCFVDTKTLACRPLHVDPEAWALFGYVAPHTEPASPARPRAAAPTATRRRRAA